MDSKGIWSKRLIIIAVLGVLLTLSSPDIVSALKAIFTPKEASQVVVQQPVEAEVTAENLADLYRERGCPNHPFTSVRIVSRSPHIILIHNFVTEAEAEYLSNVAYNPFSIKSSSKNPAFRIINGYQLRKR